MESANDLPEEVLDWDELRSKLHLSPEPAIDPDTVEIDSFTCSRLLRCPVDRLDDERLLAIYRQVSEMGSRQVRNRVSRLLDAASVTADDGAGSRSIDLYGDLAPRSGPDGRSSQAEHWLAKGRQAEAPQKAIGSLARVGDDRPPRQECCSTRPKTGYRCLPSSSIAVAATRKRLRRCCLRLVSLRARPGRGRSQTPGPIDSRHPDAGAVSQTIWSPGDDRHGRTGRCREPGRDLDARSGQAVPRRSGLRAHPAPARAAEKSKLILPGQ